MQKLLVLVIDAFCIHLMEAPWRVLHFTSPESVLSGLSFQTAVRSVDIWKSC